MLNWMSSGDSGGIKYRENWHNFRGSVAGYALSGFAFTIVIHYVVLNSWWGHAKWQHIWTGVSAATGAGH